LEEGTKNPAYSGETQKRAQRDDPAEKGKKRDWLPQMNTSEPFTDHNKKRKLHKQKGRGKGEWKIVDWTRNLKRVRPTGVHIGETGTAPLGELVMNRKKQSSF